MCTATPVGGPINPASPAPSVGLCSAIAMPARNGSVVTEAGPGSFKGEEGQQEGREWRWGRGRTGGGAAGGGHSGWDPPVAVLLPQAPGAG